MKKWQILEGILRAYDYGDQLSFFARANNEWDNLEAIFGVDPVLDAEQPVFNAKYPTFPPLKQIATRLGFLFLNTNELLDLAKPISSKVKFIGGIAMQQGATELDEVFAFNNGRKEFCYKQDFVGALSIANNASQQIILFSFGSLVKTWQIPAHVEMEIVHALCHFPNYTIIWKYDGAGPGESETESKIRAEAVRKTRKCTNLHKFTWIPQKALLSLFNHTHFLLTVHLQKTRVLLCSSPTWAWTRTWKQPMPAFQWWPSLSLGTNSTTLVCQSEIWYSFESIY